MLKWKICLILVVSFFCFGIETILAKSIQEARRDIVRSTLDYLSIPYLWGGTNPQTGLDCSGFVQLVYHRAGLKVPRVSGDQYRLTAYLGPKSVHEADLIFFAMKNPGSQRVDHVGIYVGKGYFVHASFSNGIHIDSVHNPYYYVRIVGIRKFTGF
ncbi:MAG: C40 family peptidase [Bdellovibrio sp.]|nr:C40 family peptidase [Bdellovibrio sp.]